MVRKAKLSDVKDIHTLAMIFAKKGEMLARSFAQIYECIRDYFVFEKQDKVLGVCALHVTWEDLAEVRSLAVAEQGQLMGIGRDLVKACLKEAKSLEIKRVFALTYKPGFFGKLGFKEIEKSELPHKVWADCINCPKFPDCDEIAMITEI